MGAREDFVKVFNLPIGCQLQAATKTLKNHSKREKQEEASPSLCCTLLHGKKFTMATIKSNSAAEAKFKSAKTWRILIFYLPPVATMMYILFLFSVLSPSSIETTPTAIQGSNGRSVQLESMSSDTLSVDRLDIEMAEFAYENQKGERNPGTAVNEEFAKYGANWPCFWGETAVGEP